MRAPLSWMLLAIGVVAVVAVGAINRIMQDPSPLTTPTPGPNATTPGIPIRYGALLGSSLLPPGDTAAGGQGQPVDGIACNAQEYATVHVHSHLALFVDGKQIAIPANVGFPTPVRRATCLYWLHTHDTAGILHVESPIVRIFTLGEFFDIWGQPLQSSRFAIFQGPVRAYVNGGLYVGDLRAIPLIAHQEITLEIGRPVPPPHYIFPEHV